MWSKSKTEVDFYNTMDVSFPNRTKLCLKQGSQLMFGNNFGKCGPIFKKNISPIDLWENSLCTHYKDCHVTCNMLSPWLQKCNISCPCSHHLCQFSSKSVRSLSKYCVTDATSRQVNGREEGRTDKWGQPENIMLRRPLWSCRGIKNKRCFLPLLLKIFNSLLLS